MNAFGKSSSNSYRDQGSNSEIILKGVNQKSLLFYKEERVCDHYLYMKGTARPCLGLLPGLMFSLCNQQVLYRGLFIGIHDPLGLFRVTVKEKFAKAFSQELSQEINRLFRMQGTSLAQLDGQTVTNIFALGLNREKQGILTTLPVHKWTSDSVLETAIPQINGRQ